MWQNWPADTTHEECSPLNLDAESTAYRRRSWNITLVICCPLHSWGAQSEHFVLKRSALCQPASFPANSNGGSLCSLCELYLVSGWFARKNRKETSQAGRGTADAAVMGSDKAMNCGWRLTSKVLNKDAAICDSKINVIFFPPLLLRSLFSIFTPGELSKKVPLSDIYEAPEWGGL